MTFVNNSKKRKAEAEPGRDTPTAGSQSFSREQSFLFELLPELRTSICRDYLSFSACNALTNTCRLFRGTEPKDELMRKRSQAILQHVLLGHYQEVDRLLSLITNTDALRTTLTFSGTATSSSRRTVHGTALGMALCAEDVDFTDESGRKTIEGMSELIMKHLRRIADPEDEIARQISAQFPRRWQEEDEKAHRANLRALIDIRTVIAVSTTDSDCEDALTAFRQHIHPQEVIRTGKLWDSRLLLAALQLGYNEYASFDERKNDLYYIKVIGSIQQTAPDNIAQALSQGLNSILSGGTKLRRSLKFKYDREEFFHLGPDSDLGHTYWVASERMGAGRAIGALGRRAPRLYQAFTNSKTALINTYCEEAEASLYLVVPGEQAVEGSSTASTKL